MIPKENALFTRCQLNILLTGTNQTLISVWVNVLRNEGHIEELQGGDRNVNPSVVDELDKVKDDLMVLESQTATVTNRITTLEQRGVNVWCTLAVSILIFRPEPHSVRSTNIVLNISPNVRFNLQ